MNLAGNSKSMSDSHIQRSLLDLTSLLSFIMKPPVTYSYIFLLIKISNALDSFYPPKKSLMEQFSAQINTQN